MRCPHCGKDIPGAHVCPAGFIEASGLLIAKDWSVTMTEKKPVTIQERKEKGQRVSVIDAHNERVKIKDEHPEHPNLTAYALYLLFGEKKESK